MHPTILSQSTLYWAVRPILGWTGLYHVAIVEITIVRGREYWRVFELSSTSNLICREFDDSEGWELTEELHDQAAAYERIEETFANGEIYDLLVNNCEHWAWYVATGERKSPQVRQVAWAGAAVAAGIALLIGRPTKKNRRRDVA